MPSAHNQDATEHQKLVNDTATEGGEEIPLNGNKRDRDGTPVQTSVAVTPETRRGTIVAYMSGNTLPTTPRRGEGKKKTRATEDMEDDAEDQDIQNKLDAIRKAATAAQMTAKEMGVDSEKETEHNETSTGSTNNKQPPNRQNAHNESTTESRNNNELQESPQNEQGDATNSSSDTSQHQERHTEGKQKHTTKKKRKANKKKQKKKQSHIIQAGPNGKAQLAGAATTTEDNKNEDGEVIKDKKYYDKLVKDREREFNFRVNFILLLEDATGTLEQKKSKAIQQLKKEVATFSLLDPTLVINPWRRSPPIIAPPLRIDDIEKDTTLHRYCKTVYINPNTPDKARFNMYIATSMIPSVWEEKVSSHLLGGHHGKIYRNTVNASDEVQVGYAVMSTKLSNTAKMASRISKCIGITVGIRSASLILPSERKDFYNGGYDEETVQALHFYTDREDKARAIEKLDELLTGEYSKTQIMTCPLMKFSLRSGEITGKYEEDTHSRYRKRQWGFTQNIEIQEILGKIIGPIDQYPEGFKYTLRQLILRLKNNDKTTAHLYPQLFYDVDKVGDSGITRFIYLRCLEDQAIEAAKNILAVLIRTFGNKKAIREMFTFKAQDEADRNPWSNNKMKTTGGKKGHPDLSEILCNMCKTEDDEVSEELSDSEGEDEDSETNTSKEFIPIERREIRERREFQGTHPSGGGSLKSSYNDNEDGDMDLEPPTFGDENELDDNKTMAPIANDEDKSFATGQTSCFTRKPTNDKHVVFVDMDDMSDFKSQRTLKPPEIPQPKDYQDNTDGMAEDSDGFSDQMSNRTRMPETKDNDIELKSQDTRKPPGKYKSMRDTLTKVSSELENKTERNSNEGFYQPKNMNDPSQALTQSDGEGEG